jgi:FkbM family methyltransferase
MWKRKLGLWLDAQFPKAWLQFNIWRRDKHMESEFWLVPYLSEPNSISIDIGANAGIYTFYMCQYSKFVIAFEPNVECLNKLRSRAPRNSTIVFGAVSDRTHVVELRYDRANTGIGTIDPRNTLNQFGHVEVTSFFVPSVPLDALNLREVSFIKVDVEGHESSVVGGAIETLRRERPALLIESENRHVPGAVRDIHALLSANGYSGYVLDNSTLTRIRGHNLSKLATERNNFIFLHDDKVEIYRARLSPNYIVQ